MQKTYSCVILGMGPTGLAAATRLAKAGLDFAIIDSGKPVDTRDRYAPEDATRGHGGAGLFSDGKFSFFPSATALWSLPQANDLRSAYDWTCDVLGAAGLDTPPFPTDPSAFSVGNGEWVLKDYPSDYLSLDARMDLISKMVADINGQIFNQVQVDSVTYDAADDRFTISLRHLDAEDIKIENLYARRLIFATGRFGPLSQNLSKLTSHHKFQRLEIGFRVEQSSDRAFFRTMKQLDPKLHFRDPTGDVEWRTFCVCRQGEATLTETEGLWTCSGRSDCPPTGRSNSGFNTRILSRDIASRSIAHLLQAINTSGCHYNVPMFGLLDGDDEVVEKFDGIYGKELRTIMARGLGHLASKFPALGTDRDARLIGPTLEGVGWYPEVDGDLKLLDVPAWVAGDACGLFRGIVAAMISGHYAATSVLRELGA